MPIIQVAWATRPGEALPWAVLFQTVGLNGSLKPHASGPRVRQTARSGDREACEASREVWRPAVETCPPNFPHILQPTGTDRLQRSMADPFLRVACSQSDFWRPQCPRAYNLAFQEFVSHQVHKLVSLRGKKLLNRPAELAV